jgi:hypothetical protein
MKSKIENKMTVEIERKKGLGGVFNNILSLINVIEL